MRMNVRSLKSDNRRYMHLSGKLIIADMYCSVQTYIIVKLTNIAIIYYDK